jgi:hypothetical protein
MNPSVSPSSSRPARIVSLICGSAPLILLLLLVSLAAHIHVGLGRWPTPMVDDYQSVLFRLHDHVVGAWLLFSLFGALPAWFFCQIFPRWRMPGPKALTHIALFFAGWLLIFIAARVDSTTFTAWFLD